MGLSPEQREEFDRGGYLRLPGLLGEGEVAALRRSADEAERRWLSGSNRVGQDEPFLRTVEPLIEFGDAFLELMEHPAVVPILRELLGEDLAMIDSSYFISPPRHGHGFTSVWHHDETLTGELPAPIPMFVKVFFSLTDVGEDDGPTAIVPGSHRLSLSQDPPPVDDPRQMPGMLPLVARAGDAYLFHGRMYHAGLPNTGTTTRRVLIYNYGHVWMKPWARFEPSERLRQAASTPLRRQLLHAVEDHYAARLETGVESAV